MSSAMSDASPNLTTTSHAVLAQLAVRPWSTYELARQRVRYFRYVWPRAESAIYREVKRLAAMGLVAAKREDVGERAGAVASITGGGPQGGPPVAARVAGDPGVAVRDGLRGDDPAVHRPAGHQRAARGHAPAGPRRRPGDAALQRRRQTGVPGRPGRAAGPGLPPRPGRRLLHQPPQHRRRLGRADAVRDRGLGGPLTRREERPRPGDLRPAPGGDAHRAHRPHTG